MKLARLATTLLTVAVLVACSDDPDPQVEPSESPSSPTVDDSPTSEPPETLGPEETVRAWVEARNVLLLEGEATSVEAMSAPGCKTCRYSIAPIKKVYRNGGHFETEGWQVASSRVRSQAPDMAEVSIALVIPGGRTFPAEGAEPVKYQEQKRILVVSLVAASTNWLVSKLVYLS